MAGCINWVLVATETASTFFLMLLPWFGDVVVDPVLALGFGVSPGKLLGVGVLPATDQGLAALAFPRDARCVCLGAGFRDITRDGALDGAGRAFEGCGRRAGSQARVQIFDRAMDAGEDVRMFALHAFRILQVEAE
jgi:hypothetical protein